MKTRIVVYVDKETPDSAFFDMANHVREVQNILNQNYQFSTYTVRIVRVETLAQDPPKAVEAETVRA